MTEQEALDIAHSIDLAVAPVFLIAGIGALLNVLTTRLGRVVDRSRVLEMLLAEATDAERHERIRRELLAVDQRMIRINFAVSLCTLAALLICAVVMLLFAGQLVTFDISTVIAVLFIVAMAALILALAFFLAEVSVALRTLRVRTDLLRKVE